MADVNANIGINIDSSNALAQLKALQRQISQFHTSIARSSEAAALAQKGLQKNLLNSINAIGAFSAEMRTVRTSAESFTNSLEKNKFSMREYFRYAGASTKTFGRLFKSEFDTIGKVAEERVKRLQTQYIKMGRDTNGAMKAMGIMPTQLNMSDYTTKVQIAAQKQALFNQLMKQGSTNLLNFGKNTQWAGRQLMVGFTLPLMLLGSTATKTFMEMEAQALRFRKVYGDLFTPQAETQAALDNIIELGRQFTKYGVAVSTTVGLASEAAAAGFQGLDLQRQTTQATRLSILGQVDSQKALETTISLQNAFGMSSESLADSINFLNAVENQTVVSLDDITTAIPKVAPVIQQLGGDVKDLTFFIAAMKEGGINASEGANALKSGLAALINPTKKASAMLADFGINATAIVEKNKGNLKATVVEFAESLNRLDPLARARAIEQMFGKFQFARLSTLFANVAKDGNQASRVLDLANSSVEELASLSEKELGMTAESAMNKFKKSVEDLKLALVPVGKAFLEAATPIVEFVGNILEKFANLSDGTKKLITLLTVGIGAVGPVLLMTFGLLANGVANIIKLFLTLRGGYQRLTGQSQILGEQTQYMTMEQLDAAAAAHSLNQTHANLTQTFTAEVAQINKLIAAYTSAAGAARNFSMNNPGMMMPGRGARKLASGIVSVPGRKGAGDIVPAMLSPGEAVIPAEFVEKYGPLIQGMVSGNIPGYQEGRETSSSRGMVFAHGAPGGNLSSQIVQQLSLAVSQSVKRHLEQATRVKGFSNFGFLAPEKLNKGKMSGTEGGQFFQQNAELATSRIYKSIVDLLPGAISDPSVKQDVVLFGKNIGEQLALAGSKAVSEPDFYNAVANALEKTMTQATTQAFKESLPKIQKQITTIAAFGGDINRGDRGQRISLSRASQQKGLGYEQGMVSYKGQTLTSQLKKQGFNQGQQSLTPIDRIRAQTVGTGGGANMIAGIRAGQQARYNKEDAAILEAMGIKSARSAISATEREAQTASPSRRTRRIGQDIARGLEVGMADRQDDVALAGSQLSQAATGGVRGGSRQIPFTAPGQPGSVARNIPTTPGMNINDIAAKARFNRETLLATQAQKQTAAMNQRMNTLNKAFMGGTFALSALSGVASMAGGNLGKFSQILFNITGPLFALSSIIQMLTGTKIMETLMSLGKLKFGIAAIAIGAFIVATKLINTAREKERMAIEGVGRAANLTSKQIEKLGGVLGFTPVKSNLEFAKPQVSGLSPQKSQQVEEVRKMLQDDKDFKDQVNGLKAATKDQADIIFKSIAVRLAGQGATTEAIQNYVYALQQEAGRLDVSFDFKNIDLKTAAGQAGLKDAANKLVNDVNFAFAKGYTTNKVRSRVTGEIVEIGYASDELKQKLFSASQVFSSFFMGIETQLATGKISADQFTQSFNEISNTIRQMPKAQGMMVLSETLKTMPSEIAKAATNIKDMDTKFKILEATMLGVAITQDMLDTLLVESTDGGNQRAKGRVINYLDTAIAKAKLAKEVMGKIFADLLGGKTGGTKEANALQKMITEIENQTKAFNILIKKRVEYKQALELSNNAEVANLLILAEKNGTLPKTIALVEKLTLVTKANAAAELKALPAVDKKLLELDYLKKQVDLREAIIDAQFAPQIKKENDALGIQEQKLEGINKQIENVRTKQIQPIQNLIDSNNYALQVIALQEDAINEKYDKEIKNLDKIEKANQNIANIQKQRMSIADALTRGDISAAAQAVQDARAENAQSALTGQRDTLTRVRDESIAALGRVEIEKTNKALQLEIATIEKNQLTTLESQKTTIENTIAGHNANLKALNTQVDQLKQSYIYGNSTKLEIESLEGLILKAQAAGVLFTAELLAQATAAERIAAALATKQAQGRSIEELTAGARDGTITSASVTAAERATILSSIKATIAKTNAKVAELNRMTQRKMFGGPILSKGRGGMGAVKSMAFGGRAIGSDSVPAMLTPGEFVMNKSASKAYGPLLERINESKYPGMLGGGGMTQIPVNNISTSMNDNSTAVYNYNLGFSINGANGSAKDIANAVMREIKNVDSQRIRGQRR